MLTTNQLIQFFINTKDNNINPDPSNLAEIVQYVHIDSGVDESGTGYFFRISLIELSKSDIPDEIVYKMIDDGWTLSKNRRFLEKKY